MTEDIYFWFHEGQLIKTIFYKNYFTNEYSGTVKNYDIHDRLIFTRTNLGPLAIRYLLLEIKNKGGFKNAVYK